MASSFTNTKSQNSASSSPASAASAASAVPAAAGPKLDEKSSAALVKKMFREVCKQIVLNYSFGRECHRTYGLHAPCPSKFIDTAVALDNETGEDNWILHLLWFIEHDVKKHEITVVAKWIFELCKSKFCKKGEVTLPFDQLVIPLGISEITIICNWWKSVNSRDYEIIDSQTGQPIAAPLLPPWEYRQAKLVEYFEKEYLPKMEEMRFMARLQSLLHTAMQNAQKWNANLLSEVCRIEHAKMTIPMSNLAGCFLPLPWTAALFCSMFYRELFPKVPLDQQSALWRGLNHYMCHTLNPDVAKKIIEDVEAACGYEFTHKHLPKVKAEYDFAMNSMSSMTVALRAGWPLPKPSFPLGWCTLKILPFPNPELASSASSSANAVAGTSATASAASSSSAAAAAGMRPAIAHFKPM